MVDVGKHLRLACLDGCLRLLSGHHPAQLQSVFPQLRRYDFRHAGGVLGRVGLRHRLHRHDTVFLGKVGQTAERAAVADGILEEELHTRVVQGLPGIVDHVLQHQVRLLQLVVEREIHVRVHHLQRVLVLPGELGAQHVQTGEEPAASRALLVLYALLRRLYAEVGVHRPGIAEIARQIVNGICRNGVCQCTVGRGQSVLPDLLQHLTVDTALPRLCLERECKSQQTAGNQDVSFHCFRFIFIR